MTAIIAACNSRALSSLKLTSRTVGATGTGEIVAATYTVHTDGTVKNHLGTILETWLPASAASADYDVRATLVSGTTPIGSALGSWLNLGTSREWSTTDTEADGFAETCTLTVEIGSAGSASAQVTATITINANRVS